MTYLASARISTDGLYRWRLTRRWGGSDPVVFVMLNPSTADAVVDDPTIRRCLGFARTWGYHALEVVNLYALRATNPQALWSHPDPVGPENDANILRTTWSRDVVVAWGTHAKPERVAEVAEILMESRAGATISHLGLTKAGMPKHPLYLAGDSIRFPWRGAA